jgi:Uma2 family endonuclease
MGAATLLTFEEFEKLPTEPGKMELLDGELIRLPPGKLKHTKIIHWLYDTLKPIVERAGAKHGLGMIYMEAGYKMGLKAWLQPDVSISYRDQPSNDYLEGAPALAIEVISESNTAEQTDRKVKTYLANGGTEVWVLYPKTECVWVFRTGHAEEFRGSLQSTLLQGSKIDLEELFS